MYHPSIRMKEWNGAIIKAVQIDEPAVHTPSAGGEVRVGRSPAAVGTDYADTIRHRGHLLECHRDCQEKGRPHA